MSPLRTITLLALLLAACAGVAGGIVTSSAGAVAKGVISTHLEAEPADSAARAALVREIDRGLGARWVRVLVSWGALEPTRGTYDAAQLARLDALVADLHAAGVKVMLTTCYLPAWATDSYWWEHPPVGVRRRAAGQLPDPRRGAEGLRQPRRVPRPALPGPGAGARVLERAQPVGLHLSAADRERPVLRRPRLPAHAQGVPLRGAPCRDGRARRRRRDRSRRPRRPLPHEPAALRDAS